MKRSAQLATVAATAVERNRKKSVAASPGRDRIELADRILSTIHAIFAAVHSRFRRMLKENAPPAMPTFLTYHFVRS
jgi:hypothetical protein